ncbi:MAG: 3-dehydroquinate synthase [Verrucomicrobiales bacterium]|nr:3-dehydroquinate synthase [Verrucomicrobiales bacterium]
MGWSVRGVQLQNRRVFPSIERTVAVTYRHQVHFTEGAFEPGNALLRRVLERPVGAARARALVVVDESVVRAEPSLADTIDRWFLAHADAVELVDAPLRVEGGERVKNAYFHVSGIHELIDRHHVDRHSYVLAVGGGALLDMVGLAAATAHRGLRHIRFPTTTLSQADSGVGVKNGINAFGKKNFIGTFSPPYAVINDFALLRGLPAREKRGGLAEAVKVACIRDAGFFERMEREVAALAAFEESILRAVIHRSAELHLNHIATGGDPFEFGSARPLDFGHWSAHKLEPLSDYRIRHGEAVAIGIALDVLYSRNIGLLDAHSAERVVHLLEGLGFTLYANEMHYADSAQRLVLMQGLEEFREHLGGRLTITLLARLGQGVEVNEIDSAAMLSAMDELRVRAAVRGLQVDP